MPTETAGQYKRNRIFLAIFVVSLICLFVGQSRYQGLSPVISEIINEAGVAFLIAGILGVSVDQAFRTELVRDVFTASFQYALDPALKGEILRIMRYQLICDKHLFQVSLDKLDDDAVRVNCYVERLVRNIGAFDQLVKPLLHVYEWGFTQERTLIKECKIEIGSETVYALEKQSSPDTVLFEGRERSLKPNGICTIKYRWSEIRRHNDTVDMQFATPTINPVIEISPAVGFWFKLDFGSASKEIVEESQTRRNLKGTYMPHHHMVVRWYPVSDASAEQA